MSFLPPVPVDFIRGSGVETYGGIAVNVDGSLLASMLWEAQCVHIYSLVDPSADPVVVRNVGKYPRFACFVRRNGRDTLLICDHRNDHVVEVTATGVLLRTIALEVGSGPYGIAYCEKSDVIAVTQYRAYSAVLLQYESGAVKSVIGIDEALSQTGRPTIRRKDPMNLCADFVTGVTFTTDGDFILVTDSLNHRVSKFSAASGAFIARVATGAANGISHPSGVLQCEDGSILVVTLGKFDGDGSVVHVGADGVTLDRISLPRPLGVAYSPLLNGVLVKSCDGSVFILRDAWSHSPRCAWVHACVG